MSDPATLDQLAEQARKRVHDEVFGGVSWITDARWNLTEGIIREALEAATQAQREQEVELHRELSDALAMVDAQRERLEQVQQERDKLRGALMCLPESGLLSCDDLWTCIEDVRRALEDTK